MKKFKRIAVAFLAAVTAAVSAFAVCASAAENYTAQVTGATEAKVDGGDRQQSYTVEFTQFDPTRMTKDSIVEVTYEIVEADKSAKGDKVELVAQRYSDNDRKKYKGKSGETPSTAKPDGAIWKIVKADKDNGKGKATFSFSSIADAFGSEDFTNLDKLNVEAASSATIKCTGFTVTNVKSEKEGTHPSSSNGIEWYWIVVAVAAAVIIVIIIVFVILNKKSDKAFDVSTGEFVDKKKMK